jgi:hypothetical protein
VRVSLVYDEDGQGNRRECKNTADTIADCLPAFTDLEELWLQDYPISDDGLRHLRGLRNLRQLYVNGTKTTDEGRAQLRKAIPGLVIHE